MKNKHLAYLVNRDGSITFRPHLLNVAAKAKTIRVKMMIFLNKGNLILKGSTIDLFSKNLLAPEVDVFDRI